MNIFQPNIGILLLALYPTCFTFGQVNESLLEDAITLHLESTQANQEDGIEQEAYISEIWNYYYRHPIKLDQKCESQIRELSILNETQIEGLMRHIRIHGNIRATEELQQIPTFDRDVIQNLLPFVSPVREDFSHRNQLDPFWHHMVRSRFGRTIQQSKGYKGEKSYLGNPTSWLFQYSIQHNKNIEAGFSVEKDAGEVFHPLRPKQWDYRSGYVSIGNFNNLNRLILGDFKASFGQGLTFSNTPGIGKSSVVNLIGKPENIVRPYTSIGEQQGLRGVLIDYKIKSFNLTSFYSNRNMDATTIETSEGRKISSLYTSGFHRTDNELEKKNSVSSGIALINFEYKKKAFGAGITLVKNTLSLPYIKNTAAEKVYNNPSPNRINQGFHFNLNKSNYHFFGEISRSDNSNYAGIIGMTIMPDRLFSFSFLARNYTAGFSSGSSGAFGENSTIRNEKGFYMGWTWNLFHRSTLMCYVDVFQFPWLKYQVSAPSMGVEYLAQFVHKPDRNKEIRILGKLKESVRDVPDREQTMKGQEKTRKFQLRLQYQHQVRPNLRWRSRLELSEIRTHNGKSGGVLFFQELKFIFNRLPVSIVGRFTLFETDDYASRIYAYEQDVDGVYQVPSFAGTGSRIIALVKYKFMRHHAIQFKIGHSVYENVQVIGSGLDEITGDAKTQFQLQYLLRL